MESLYKEKLLSLAHVELEGVKQLIQHLNSFKTDKKSFRTRYCKLLSTLIKNLVGYGIAHWRVTMYYNELYEHTCTIDYFDNDHKIILLEIEENLKAMINQLMLVDDHACANDTYADDENNEDL